MFLARMVEAVCFGMGRTSQHMLSVLLRSVMFNAVARLEEEKMLVKGMLMERGWSKQSPHIRTLYAPWQPGDGYEESIITTAEEQISSRLPTPLRIFYQAWGRRKDLTQTNQILLGPDKLLQRPDALIFCVENQGGSYWAIGSNALGETDPPVLIADVLLRKGMPDLSSPLAWEPSHAHISDFLDSLTYQHAFWGGAIHGGSGRFQPQAFHEDLDEIGQALQVTWTHRW